MIIKMNIIELLNNYTSINDYDGFNNIIYNNENIINEIFNKIEDLMDKSKTEKIRRLFIIKFLIMLYNDLTSCYYEEVDDKLKDRFYYNNYKNITKRYLKMSCKIPKFIKNLYHFDLLPYLIYKNKYDIII